MNTSKGLAALIEIRRMGRPFHKLKGSDNYMKRVLSSLDGEKRMGIMQETGREYCDLG